MVALGACGPAILPFAGQAQVTGALSANVVIAKVIIEGLGIGEDLLAREPLASVSRRGFLGRGGGSTGRGGVGLRALRRIRGCGRGRGRRLGRRRGLAHEGIVECGEGVEAVEDVEGIEGAVEGVLEGGERDEMGEGVLRHGAADSLLSLSPMSISWQPARCQAHLLQGLAHLGCVT